MTAALARLGRSRRLRWLGALALVLLLVFLAVATVVGRADRQQADDPRSSTPAGAGAVAALLDAEGVRLRTVDQVPDAVQAATGTATVVVARADRLTDAEAARLLATPAARIVLLRPDGGALERFGVRAVGRAMGQAGASGVREPDCALPQARRAGAAGFEDSRASYRATGTPEAACYPADGGFGYLRADTTSGRPVELLAGGISNAQLGRDGNAALAMNVLGSQPDLVWLMARAGEDVRPVDEPTLLPPWWGMAAVQAALALVVVGVWRGRRLGPILTEPLPVTVRASETVEGHGRLYQRLNARDRAAEALRTAARSRLSRVLGHADDPGALSEVVAARTGRDPVQVGHLLAGPAPTTDDDLVALTRSLDRLEQETRQP